jgi:acetyl-CoA decarbonylase/synthase complex subunit beta
MAESTAGGRQVDGFHGISIEYMRSKKFLQGDEGYAAVAWMPKEIKEKLAGYIPEPLYDAIATEQDVQTIDALREFLASHHHPLVGRWKHAPPAEPRGAGTPVLTADELPLTAGGFRIVLKNARIYAEKVTIHPVQPKTTRGGDKHG